MQRSSSRASDVIIDIKQSMATKTLFCRLHIYTV
jgi:hypothetical protein